MTRNGLFLFGGVLAFVAAVAILGGLLAVSATDGAIVVVAFLALLASIGALSRRRDGWNRAETPEPERRTRVPVPGTDLLDVVDEFRPYDLGFAVTSRRIVLGLRGAAVAVLTRFEGLSAEEAQRRVDDGTWTTDPVAAATLSPTLEEPALPLRRRIAAIWTGESASRRGIRRSVAAITALGTPDAERPPEPRRDDEPTDEPVATRTTTRSVDDRLERTPRSTGYWAGIGVVALVAIGVGALAESAAVVLAGVVGVGYAGFARAFDAPRPDVSLERTVSDETPDPGDDVEVTLTITNDGELPVPDLRVVDGVPPGIAVTDGTARLGTALRPGDRVRLEYTVEARRGNHRFDPALLVTRGLSRSRERETLVTQPTRIVCEPSMRPTAVPVRLRSTAATFAGRLRVTEGGSGTEFHSVREYRRNDPLNRIDWNRRARTGDLATLEFHEERAARVLVLVDARATAYLAPEPAAEHAVDRSVDAAGRIAASLLDRGDSVGLAALGPTGRGEETADPCWLAPGSGSHHRAQVRELLATHPQCSTSPPERETAWLTQLRTIRRRLSSGTQVVLLTPLCNRGAVDVARRLDARGHAVTVVSPDPTADRTAGQGLARIARRIRRFDLERAGIPVVDWSADRSLDEALARANAGDAP
ncbi:DUF58 domain-containing protein [Natronobeatus ordinarius]|uniref:DUF58 domain-containing protein n=1 Tax=Natronobeatus ordinarius TaxID=2963433 RepID=UPI0020CCBFC0|nr:DUF58 domain-containing protein [Natronobeatus ordinarius]